jgi:L,D-transpeptidase YcbB
LRKTPWFLLMPVLITLGLVIPRAVDAIEENPSIPQETAQDDPIAQGLHQLLKQGAHFRLEWGHFPDFQGHLEHLYQATRYTLLWTHEGKPTRQARTAVTSLNEAEMHGLKASDYDAKYLADWVNFLDGKTGVAPEELILFDTALSLTLMRYSKALHAGRIDPEQVNFRMDLGPSKQHDYEKLIEQLTQDADVSNTLVSLGPKLPIYQRLKAALVRYQELAKDNSLTEFTFNSVVRPGGHHEGTVALRRLVRALGDLPADVPEPPTPDLYDPELMNAIQRFQRRHGLEADGIIGKKTYLQLVTPLSQRVKQIELNLERLRWLPEPFSSPYILINIPAFQLFGFRQSADIDKPDLVMNVIVGQAIKKRTTPIFYADMRYVSFRPYWNLPYSITKDEVLPELLRDPHYLARNALEIVDNFAPSTRPYDLTQETVKRLRAGTLKLRQRPGPKNALGSVKFILPNDNGVYLHGTPAKQLFNRARRDFSHGCIRVEDLAGLAEFVLNADGEWPRDRIVKAMNSSKTVTAHLKTPIPVYVFYLTVSVDDTGGVFFYEDIYGHDAVLEQALAKGYPYPFNDQRATAISAMP